jgi:ketosteroid isomerase-like protein
MSSPDSSTDHPHVRHYKRMIEAFNGNDLGVVAELLHPDVIYTVPGQSVLASVTRGIAAHLEMLRLARERSGNTLKLEPRALVTSGEHLFVYGRISAMRGEKALDSDHMVIFRFIGGRIVEGRTVPIDLYAFDAFWA